ncbi:hypothetical protein FOA43_000713 [Brettanomyces nanus]|uniref:Arrestin-like N-terminal domain-containing protein n=1 Tax=Eeniella nana TaxID=13502 RepID=A0A875RXW6_EENNA|nr:uncharacterized protein FOA43_000713 [Brettanomyces nanus]QPG73403.1 hypothetical protein FOA43_000713 [Brettanomyces nanus]
MNISYSFLSATNMVSCCDIEIVLDKLGTSGVYSNYDTIQGEVILKVHTSTRFNAVQVKMEGISRTILEVMDPVALMTSTGTGVGQYSQPRPQPIGHKRSVLETHKLLQDTVTVLPSPSRKNRLYSRSILLDPGKYNFSFQFRIPLKNKCTGSVSLSDEPKTTEGPRNNRLLNDYQVHVERKLPPSFSQLGHMALIRYFVKATAVVRTSQRRTLEATAYEPFIFLPLDDCNILMSNDMQAYTRRGFVLKNKYPEIVAASNPARVPIPQERKASAPQLITSTSSSGFLKAFFSTPGRPVMTKAKSYNGVRRKPLGAGTNPHSFSFHVKPINVRVVFEMRMRHPAFLIPSRSPTYQLYLLTKSPPEKFQLFNGMSSGLGSVYLRYLKLDLVSITDCFVSSYKKKVTKTKTIYENQSFHFLLDLACTQQSKPYQAIGKKLYEIAIPKKLYEDAIVPDNVPPSFRTCNMERKYKLLVSAGFADHEYATAGTVVTLETAVEVMSGMEPVMEDPDVGVYASRTELYRAMREAHSTSPDNVSNGTVPMTSSDGLPTYDEVVKETNHRRTFTQNDSYYVDIND